jgi:hypothetical protein
MAIQMNDKLLFRECAAILEGLKQVKLLRRKIPKRKTEFLQFNDAGAMHERGQQYDKAATIYLKSDSFHEKIEI